MEEINLDVQWHDGRAVRVRIYVAPTLGMRREWAERRNAHAIGSAEVDSLNALHGFLRTITREGDVDTTVDAVCFEPQYFKMLELLEVEGPPPPRIVVPLPAQ